MATKKKMKTKKTAKAVKKKATAKKRPVKKVVDKKVTTVGEFFVKVIEGDAELFGHVLKKAKANKAQKVTGIAAKILEDKGEKWVKNNCGTTEPTTAHNITNLVYYHYLESDDGEKVWDTPGQNEGKVDYIFDSIYDKYIHDLGWMTEDEWQAISDNLYSMVYEGVF